MNILIYSDLHNEFVPFKPDPALLAAVDLVILAGDIGTRHRGVEWTKTWAPAIPGTPVLMIAGNHEFYGGHFDKVIGEMRNAAKGTNIHVLENDQVIIDGVRFLRCTMWTDFKLYGLHTSLPSAIESIRLGLTDYRKITASGREAGSYRKLHPRDTLRRHELSRAWLKNRLVEPFSGSTVVITHHAPSARSIPGEFEGDVTSAAYASDLDSMSGEHVRLWIHGHIHESMDYEINGTRILCNPRGYAPKYLNEDFNPSLVIELD
ncbi:metallophosphoesterase [Paraburkholderia sp. SIMBA_053]|uniref:metallophosphoesterase n=1 Tax=Paraburkholderia sp. SIMBA_053 TaxID=3085794 RepID=UPI00397E04B9